MIVPDRLKALIVDDNAYARVATAATLRKLGLTSIEELGGGAAAVGAILANRYDVMFMDWYMPDMNGAALLEIIRDARFSPNGKLPVIMITAYPNRETTARARELGANEVLAKPFTANHVATALSRVIPDDWSLPADEPPKEKGQFFL